MSDMSGEEGKGKLLNLCHSPTLEELDYNVIYFLTFRSL